MAYSEITAAEIAAGKPPTSILFGKFRDNYETLYNVRQCIEKQTATSRDTTEVLSTDPDLHFPVGSDEIWKIDLLLIVLDDFGGMDIYLYVPAETDTGYFSVFWETYGIGGDDLAVGYARQTTNSEFKIGDNATIPHGIRLSGYIYTGTVSSGDEFEVQWAQNASHANSTTVYAGSVLMAWRMDTL